MNLSQIRTRLRRRIGNPDTGDVSNTDLNEYINDSYRELAVNYSHHKVRKICTFPTVVGTADYGIPADAGAILGVRDTTNNVKLVKFGLRRGDTVTVTQNGRPQAYERIRGFVRLYPPPDGIYTIRLRYRENITDLSADGDEPLIPMTWHFGIVLHARWNYFDDKGDIPKATHAWNTFVAWVEGKQTEIEEESIDLDSGVELPTLAGNVEPRLDFDEAE